MLEVREPDPFGHGHVRALCPGELAFYERQKKRLVTALVLFQDAHQLPVRKSERKREIKMYFRRRLNRFLDKHLILVYFLAFLFPSSRHICIIHVHSVITDISLSRPCTLYVVQCVALCTYVEFGHVTISLRTTSSRKIFSSPFSRNSFVSDNTVSLCARA